MQNKIITIEEVIEHLALWWAGVVDTDTLCDVYNCQDKKEKIQIMCDLWSSQYQQFNNSIPEDREMTEEEEDMAYVIYHMYATQIANIINNKDQNNNACVITKRINFLKEYYKDEK